MLSKYPVAFGVALLLGTSVFAATPAEMAGNKPLSHHHVWLRQKRFVSEGDREVAALNTLEAAGYRHFQDVHASGRDFVAVTTKAGKIFDVTVLPSGQIQSTST